MTKKQKKQFATYIFIFIAAVICLIYEKTGRSKIIDAPSQDAPYSYVHFIDAGQGDCTLIETHDGKFALIDASTDIEKHKVLSYLENEGVEELEYVIFTHPHEDHIGGGDDVIENFVVKNIYMTEKTENSSCYEKLIRAILDSNKRNGTKVLKPQNGDVFNLGNMEFLVLSDGKNYFDNTNNSSICIRMELGKSTFLFTGDAEKKVEYDLLDSTFSLDAEVFKCAHHGSTTSNSNDFLDAVSPDISVISCGLDNDYGHPHDEIIEELTERGIDFRRTDLDGSVVIAFNENEIVLTESSLQA